MAVDSTRHGPKHPTSRSRSASSLPAVAAAHALAARLLCCTPTRAPPVRRAGAKRSLVAQGNGLPHDMGAETETIARRAADAVHHLRRNLRPSLCLSGAPRQRRHSLRSAAHRSATHCSVASQKPEGLPLAQPRQAASARRLQSAGRRCGDGRCAPAACRATVCMRCKIPSVCHAYFSHARLSNVHHVSARSTSPSPFAT
mmetsp:Transcript_9308/g.30924  ORF Transcript_9308/g.30924 Transcript_9308/m.30924 type:complete len:200 (-) Transcript_9308:3-602(-)